MSLANAPVGPIVPSTDLERSLDFYQNMLGLEQLDVGGSADSPLFFAAGNGTNLVVYFREQGNQAQHTQVGFMVEDIRATVEALTNNGVTFEHYDFPGLQTDEMGIAQMGDNLSAWFLDPDGNILSINQM